MVRIFLTLVGMVIGTGLLVACASTTAPQPTDAPGAASPEATDISTLRPKAPAGESEDFRPDSPLLVAATGRPQLIEVFSYD